MNKIVIDAWYDASDVTRRLIGSWSFDRVIEGQGRMQGLAVFTRVDTESLAYREQGRLELLNGTVLEAMREYVFRNAERGFDVFFKEIPLRLFHAISLSAEDGTLSGQANHLCNLDQYQSAYTFRSDGSFVVRHVVSGPRKDYTMITLYNRAA